MTRAETVCSKINQIRMIAGNPLTKCPTCCCGPYEAYRRVVNGKIIEGCIDSCHVGSAQSPGNYSAWFWRPEANDLRAKELKALRNRK